MKRKLICVALLSAVTALTACGSTGTTSTSASANNASGKTESETAESETDSNVENESNVEHESNAENESDKKDDSKQEERVEVSDETKLEMDTTATIEPTVLYEDNGVKITATELEITRSRVEVSLDIENTCEEKREVYAGTLGYTCNAVNGLMISRGYVNSEILPGKKAKETIYFDKDELLLYGIDAVKEIEIGFYLDGETLDEIKCEPVQLTTSLYDAEAENEYCIYESITSEASKAMLSYTVPYASMESAFEENGVRLLSEVLVENQYGEYSLFLEFENTSEKPYNIRTSNISINGLVVCSSDWSGDWILPDHRAVVVIELDNLLDEEYLNALNIASYDQISMDIGLKNMDYEDMIDPEPIEIIVNSEGEINLDGDVVYEENDIRIISKGAFIEDSEYSPDMHFLLLVQNNSSHDVRISDVYDTFSINDCMCDGIIYSKTISAGAIGLFDIEVPEYYYEEIDISSIDEVNTYELQVELKDANYHTLDEPVINVELK